MLTVANDLAVRHALEAAGVEFIDDNGGGPGVRLRQRPRPRPLSNHGCLRRRMIKAMAIRGLSPTTRRRVDVQLVFGRCPDRFGLEVAPHLIIAREKCVQSAREAA